MPQSLTELVAFLTACPALTVTSDLPGVSGPRTFRRFADGGLWMADASGQEKYIPLGCGHTGSETSLRFDERGFTIRKFGKTIRFDYAAEIAAT